MAIEVEFFTLTGMLGNVGVTGILNLNAMPSTGPYGIYDIAVDPTDGPTQTYGVDFGITGQAGNTGGALVYNLPTSEIKNVILDKSSGVTGPLVLRVIYNY